MLHIFKTTDEVLDALAHFFIETANQAMESRGRFVVSLSGGSSPKKLYELLASDAYNKQTDWSKVFFFFGDERNVPDTHPDSNALMVKKALFEPLHIAADHIFAINTTDGPDAAATAYTETINTFFKGETAVFDLVLLGLGDNSHTLSLFPHTKVLHVDTPKVQAVFLPDEQVYRITLTAPLANQARQLAFLVYGSGKAEAVHHILKGETDIEEYPAQLIRKDAEWFLDDGAAALVR